MRRMRYMRYYKIIKYYYLISDLTSKKPKASTDFNFTNM